MIKAFVDDSGSDQANEWFVLGALVAPSRDWGYTEEEWGLMLEKWNIKFFKMSLAQQCEGPFKGWDKDKRNACVKEFFEIIKRRGPIPVGAAINKATIKRFLLSRKKPTREMRHYCEHEPPYPLLMFSLIGRAELASEAIRNVIGAKGKLFLIFDRQHGFGKSREAIRITLAALRPKIHGFAHVESKQFVLLQAADLYAWALRKKMAREPFPPHLSYMKRYLDRGRRTLIERVGIKQLRETFARSRKTAKK